MRTKVRHVDLHPDEFLAAVAGEMSPAELGVYWMVCLLCYARGGDIDADADWIRAKFRPGRGNRVVGDILESLIANGKVVRDRDEIGVRRVRDELEIALRRIRDAHENGTRGGRKSKKINDVDKPNPFFRKNLRARNHQPPRKEERAPYEALSVLSARDAPPLPPPRDGAALRAPTPKAEPAGPAAVEDPALLADGIAAFDRCLDAVRGKLPVMDAEATTPPPPDPRLIAFRARLQRLNTVASERLGGNTRLQAWETIAEADALGDPLACSPEMLAGLAAIERLQPCAEAAE